MRRGAAVPGACLLFLLSLPSVHAHVHQTDIAADVPLLINFVFYLEECRVMGKQQQQYLNPMNTTFTDYVRFIFPLFGLLVGL